jgi:NADH-quinone oxidoreductase subunit C
MAVDAALNLLRLRFGAENINTTTFRDNHRVTVPSHLIYQTLKCLKEEAGFDFLVDITAADYLNYPDARDRFAVIYCLLNTADGSRLVVKTWVNDPDPTVPSVYFLWRGADWMEREVYDLFGINFADHPDLRRLLLPEEYESHPLRKDYPLRGRGERHNFPVITRAES